MLTLKPNTKLKKKMKRPYHNKAVTCLTLVAMLLFTGTAIGAGSFDHRYVAWNKLLTTHTENGFVNYQDLKESPEDLTAVMESFQAATEDEYDPWSRNQKIAFWLNAYNFAAMNLIVEHYPIQKKFGWKALAYPDNSIQQIPDVWDRESIEVLGKERSLNEIEHEILRKEFKDPRVHFVLVCASIGCPKLRAEPYVPERLEEQLDEQVRVFMSDTEKARYERENDTLYLSPILKWFGDDFEAAGGRVAFVKKYLPRETANHLSDKSKIKWLDYDWSLNEGKAKS